MEVSSIKTKGFIKYQINLFATNLKRQKKYDFGRYC